MSKRHLAVVALLALWSAPVLAATEYETELDPVAFDNSTRANVGGEGTAIAALDGSRLIIHGHFGGLTSDATAAQLRMGAAMGVPGDAIGTLEMEKDGHITGAFTLTRAQRAALDAGGLYVQVNSAKGPDGSLWGWFEKSSHLEGAAHAH